MEATNSSRAGLARHLHDAGLSVTEVLRPKRHTRRMNGTSDRDLRLRRSPHRLIRPRLLNTKVRVRCGGADAHHPGCQALGHQGLHRGHAPDQGPPSSPHRPHCAAVTHACPPPRRLSALAHGRGQPPMTIPQRASPVRPCAVSPNGSAPSTRRPPRADQTLKALITQTNPQLLQARGVGLTDRRPTAHRSR